MLLYQHTCDPQLVLHPVVLDAVWVWWWAWNQSQELSTIRGTSQLILYQRGLSHLDLYSLNHYPLHEVKETTADKLYLQSGSVLRETWWLLRETGKDGQVREPRALGHSGKLWGWSCHLVWFGLVYCFGLGWGSLLIGIGIFADKAWFSMKNDGQNVLPCWIPPPIHRVVPSPEHANCC